MNAAAQAIAPVTAGVSMNVGFNEEVKMNVPGISLSIDTNQINQEMPVHVPIPVPQPALAEHAQVNMQIPGFSGGMNMNVNTTSSATYHEERTVNGVTTSSTSRMDHVPMPVPVPNMSAHSTAGDGHSSAQVNIGGMNMKMDMNVGHHNSSSDSN